ncbi:MAG: glycogen synthase GlgA [Thermodesulfovibrionia bacterium]|nr:glycogen synthase GlgA [Thermodesulfovibrionia bacterium]
MKILIASSEAVPFVKTGGLADVAGVLANEYKKMGLQPAVILPLYREIKKAASSFNIKPLNKEIAVRVGNDIEKGILWKGTTSEGADAYFIENEKYYDRDELYCTPEGDYPDNAARFIFFSRGTLEALKALNLRPDIIHCNDWQTALIPVYLKKIYRNDFPKTATLLTIHNLGYQGIFPKTDMPLTGLGWEMFNMNALEFYGKINFLKAGIIFSDIITTVSRTYAQEILTPEHGFGLEGVLRERKDDLYGIINGIDLDYWGPLKDKFIPANYSSKDLSGKAICKRSLQAELGLPVNSSPLIGLVSRLSSQKGLDLVIESMEEILRSGAQIAVLGKGDEFFQNALLECRKKYPGHLSVTIGFEEALGHKIYAGSDIFLMPSMYEPCGLGQLIALRYGAVPVVRKTGGLADTVSEYSPSEGKGTGFLLKSHSSEELMKKLQKAIELYYDKKEWDKIVKNTMAQDFSWGKSTEKYVSLYKKALKAIT